MTEAKSRMEQIVKDRLNAGMAGSKDAETTRTGLGSIVPRASALTDEERMKHRATVEEFAGDVSAFDQLMQEAEDLSSSRDALDEALSSCDEALRQAQGAIPRFEPLGVEGLIGDLTEVQKMIGDVQLASNTYQASCEGLFRPIREAIDRTAGVS